MKNNSYRKYTDLAKTLELNTHSECIAKVKFLEVKQTLIKPAYSMEGNCKPCLPASQHLPSSVHRRESIQTRGCLCALTPELWGLGKCSAPVTGWQG